VNADGHPAQAAAPPVDTGSEGVAADPRPAVPDERPMRADARRNHDRLIVAARNVFNEHGPDASLDDIARQAGVGAGTLYRHFPNRHALLAAVYRRDVEDIAGIADEFAARYPPEEALFAWLRHQLDYVTHLHGLGGAIKTILGSDHETMTLCRDEMRGAAGRLLTPAQEAGLIRKDVEPANILRLVHGVGVACETAPEQADLLLGIMLDGLRPPTR
jgi:AcrR family transcriptional regulator